METKQLETTRTNMKAICKCFGCRTKLSMGKRLMLPTEYLNWSCTNCNRNFSMEGIHDEDKTDGSFYIKINEFKNDGLGIYKQYHLIYNATTYRWSLILAYERKEVV